MSINEKLKKKVFLTARSRTLNSFLQICGILKADQWKEVQNDEFSEKGYRDVYTVLVGGSVGKWLVRRLMLELFLGQQVTVFWSVISRSLEEG